MYQFITDGHESRFKELCIRDGTHVRDVERGAIFFLIAGNDLLYKKVDSIYDFEESAIRPEVYDEAFLTGGTRSLIDLAFSLYGCGTCDVRQLFSQLDDENSILAIEAVKTRFRISGYPKKKRARRTGENEHQKFVSSVLDFLGDEVVEAEEYYYNSVTVSLKDVNFEVDGVEWEQVIQEHLKENGYDNVGFEYGEGNWVTVNKK